MRQHRSLHAETKTASGAILANRFVTFGGTQADTLGEPVLGISQYQAQPGEDLAVDTIGTATVEVGGTLVAGDDITSDDQGRAVKRTLTAQYKIGHALEELASQGSFTQILFSR